MKQSKFFIILMLLALTLGLAACSPEDADAPQRAWIDYPRDGMTLNVGEIVSVYSHGYARDGLAEALLSVNGEVYRRDGYAAYGTAFSDIYQEWKPQAPGVYTLQVTVYDINGVASLPAMISVRVGEIVVEVGEEIIPVITDTPTLVPEIADTPTFTPSPTIETVVEEAPACPPVATTVTGANCRSGPSPDYPVITSFVVGHSATVLGRNANSSWWMIENAGGSCWIWDDVVELNPTTCQVAVQAAPPLPPTLTPTPTNTPVPVDNTPPDSPVPQVPANGLLLSCRSRQTLAWTPVDDPSGIEGYYVEMEKEVTSGNWQDAGSWGPISGKQVEVPVDCGVGYRWAVRARDNAGNWSNWSSVSSFGINLK